VNRYARYGAAALLAALVAAGGVVATRHRGTPVLVGTRGARGCRAGGCGDAALVRILPYGPNAGQLAAGTLTTATGKTVTVSRASTKQCFRGPDVNLLPALTSGWNSFQMGNAPSSAAAPDGAMVATTLTPSLAVPGGTFASTHYKTLTLGAGTYTFSVYLKTSAAPQTTYISIFDGGASYTTSSCVMTTSYAPCSVTRTVSAGAWTFTIGADSRDAAEPSQTATPFYAAWARVDPGSSVNAYTYPSLATVAANKACVEPQGLLLEGQSTNYVLRSADLDNAAWTTAGGVTTGLTVTANVATAPDGTLAAEQVADDGSNSFHIIKQATAIPAGTGTQSVYAKAGTQTCLQLATVGNGATAYANFNLAAGTAQSTGGTAVITAVGGGWYRLAWTTTMAAGETFQHVFKQNASCSGVGSTYVGTTGNYLYLWQVQAEALPFATSPIATAGTAVSRAADVAAITNPFKTSDTVNCLSARVLPYQWAATGVERSVLSVGGNSGSANTVSVFLQTGNTLAMNVIDTTPAVLFLNVAPPASGSHRLTMCRTGAATATYALDGVTQSVTVGGSAPGALTQPTSLYIGSYAASGSINGWLSDICVATSPGACK
jgi:hypothetical protein